MTMTQDRKRQLRGLAHGRRPVVWIGANGATEGVRRELDAALTAHELVKASVRVGDRERRDLLIAELSSQLGAEVVQRIGNVVTLFRARPPDPPQSTSPRPVHARRRPRR